MNFWKTKFVYFLLSKKECGSEYLEVCEKIGPEAGFEPTTYYLFNFGATPHIYYAKCQRVCRHQLCASWAKSVKGKKLQLLNWLFCCQKLFQQKIETNWNKINSSRIISFIFPTVIEFYYPCLIGKDALPPSLTVHVVIVLQLYWMFFFLFQSFFGRMFE